MSQRDIPTSYVPNFVPRLSPIFPFSIVGFLLLVLLEIGKSADGQSIDQGVKKKDRAQRNEQVNTITKTLPSYLTKLWTPTYFAPFIRDN